MFIAPPVENSKRSQCCARADSDVSAVMLSIESFWAKERSGFLEYVDVTLREESSTKAVPKVCTIAVALSTLFFCICNCFSHNFLYSCKRRNPWPPILMPHEWKCKAWFASFARPLKGHSALPSRSFPPGIFAALGSPSSCHHCT